MKCLNCQSDIPDGSKFCKECGTKLSSATSALTTLNEKIDKIQRYLPQGLTEKILDQKERIEGERKQVTVLFCDLVGYTSMSVKLGPEDTYSIMDQVLEILIHKVHDYGGTVNQLLGDGLYALFGVPLAIEDASSRAIRAGIDMHKDISEFSHKITKEKNIPPLRMRIGINSGPVVVGTIGNSLRVDFAAVGDTVNLASRMEGLAEPGTIAVTGETHKRAELYFNFEDLGEKTVKGKEEPVSVFKVLSEKEKIHRRHTSERIIQSAMVGREAEMDKLELAVVKVKNGEGSIVNIIGDAGIGKSRLIAELKSNDVVKRTVIREGRALSMGRNLSFYPIIEILKGFAGIGEDDSATEQLRKLESAIKDIHPGQVDEIFPFTATLMGMKLAGKHAERVKEIEGDALNKLILRNLRELLIKSTEISPLILIIDDLHWADTSTLDLMISLFKLARDFRIVFINVFRPHYLDTGEKLLLEVREEFAECYTEIFLHRLEMDQSDRLIANLINIKGLPTEMRELIKKRSEGNPFFIEEIVRSLIDEGAVEIKEGQFSITGKIKSFSIPHTIQELIMSRIDRLDEKTRSLIKIASVIGRNFFHKILTEVAGSVEDIEGKITYLKEIQLIRQSQKMEEVEYLFKHALAQEAAYESILLQKRKALHLQVAETIERIFSERLHEFYGMLAFHYSQGEDLNKVEEFMLKAGEEAMKISASSEAVNFLRNALELYTGKYGDQVDPQKIARMEANIALAYLNRGLYVEAVEFSNRALMNMGIKEPKGKAALAVRILTNLFIIFKNIYFPSKKPKKIPTDLDIRIFGISYEKTKALMPVNLWQAYISMIMDLRALLQFDVSKSQLMFNHLSHLGILSVGAGSPNITRRTFDFVQNCLNEKNSRISLYYYKLWKLNGSNYLDIGLAQKHYDEKFADDALKIGDAYAASAYLLWSGQSFIARGDFATSGKIRQKLEVFSTELDDAHAEADFYEISSLLLIKQYKPKEALLYVNAGIRLMEKVAQEGRKASFLGLRLQAEILQNELSAGEKTFAEALKLIEKSGFFAIVPIWFSYFQIGAIMYHLCKLQNTMDSTDKLDISRLKKSFLFKTTSWSCRLTVLSNLFLDMSMKVEVFRLTGSYYWLLGKQKKALKWFAKSIKQGERQGARPDLARTYFEVGKQLSDSKSKYKQLNGVTAEEYLEKARVLFEEMDLEWDLEQLEKVKATSH
ncbi:MAG: AAA family ATPase [Deltaproteobacteria bacterium]|jgi:class 3 adenylate cyclase|nr:AAA family ATPase [Deltaproteobacteria bacterium]MBT4269339.1 AAA family ATPase [Deltaproteobacteria bacterium]MBT6611813.1 AAA family ATPase [Deltaproteobacteria bacterium]MBT7155273.1 AAA family ATPase [Deltaproteobacteria bacterium]